jgi:hypothetical protein
VRVLLFLEAVHAKEAVAIQDELANVPKAVLAFVAMMYLLIHLPINFID